MKPNPFTAPMRPTWAPPAEDTRAAFVASRPVPVASVRGIAPGVYREAGQTDRGGGVSHGLSTLQVRDLANESAWARHGVAKGYIVPQKKSFLDRVSGAVNAVVQTAVVAGITGGVAGGFGYGPFAAPAAAAPVAPAAAPVSVGLTAEAALPAYSSQIAAAQAVSASAGAGTLASSAGAVAVKAKAAASTIAAVASTKAAIDSVRGVGMTAQAALPAYLPQLSAAQMPTRELSAAPVDKNVWIAALAALGLFALAM